MTQSLENHAEAPQDPEGTFNRVGSDEESHEYLIDLYFDDEEQASGMADRFPSLNDFDAGNFLLCHSSLARRATPYFIANTTQQAKQKPKAAVLSI